MLSYCKLIFLILLTSVAQIFGQEEAESEKCYVVDDKDAIKLYEKGIDKKKYKKPQRLEYLKKALEIEPEYPEANFALANEKIVTIKLKGGTYLMVQPLMLKVIDLCPKLHSDPYYYVGFSFYEQEKYLEAVEYLEKFVNFKADSEEPYARDYDDKVYQSKQMIKYAKVYKEINDLRNNPVPFDPHPVSNICTDKDEYLPIISPDNAMALFTRRQSFTSKNQVWQSDKLIEIFSFSKRLPNGKFEEGGPMPKPPFNMNENEGGATISIDNKHIFYTICKDEGGTQLNCDVYYSDFIDGKWTEVQKVEGINDPVYWDSQPSIAADGKSLYFASDRKGGYGGIDIYKSVRDETGTWSIPVNLGDKINTPANDKSPFMHSDSETLYFASEGHPGFGGFDIFYVRKDDKGDWLEPKNIGYPINTEADDLAFFASTDGKYGYFASNNRSKVKGRTKGGWDIYSFELYDEARPAPVAFVKGSLNTESGEKLTGAEVEITTTDGSNKAGVVVDTSSGEYAAIVNIKKKEEFLLTVKKDGYAFNSEMISIDNDSIAFDGSEPMKIDFEVKKTKVGQKYQLNNIYYATNSADLRKESMLVIDKFVEYLRDNPSIRIEIHGHTDNVGDDASNITLSTDRAFTVYEILQSKGISKGRLAGFKGFGESMPIASNDTKEGRAKNRRTEFVIVAL